MLQPPIFREDRVDVMQALMVAHPFATIVSAAAGSLTADHAPLVLEAKAGKLGVLRGHLAATNPLFRETDGQMEVLTIFQGPQTYITPSWYASKKEHGKVVPTWNYVVVHARGILRFTREPQWLLSHLKALTAQHESHRDEPWAVSDAPEDFIARQLRGIVGFEISIDGLEGVWKVSQNKLPADQTGVRDGLETSGNPDAARISALVQERARS